jgi:hypothetical protein
MHLPPLAGRLLFTTMHAPNGFTHLRHLAQDPEAAAAAAAAASSLFLIIIINVTQ